MADRVLTLCDSCKAEFETAYRVRQISGKTTTERKKACENCGNRAGGMCKQYIVSGKGKAGRA